MSADILGTPVTPQSAIRVYSPSLDGSVRESHA